MIRGTGSAPRRRVSGSGLEEARSVRRQANDRDERSPSGDPPVTAPAFRDCLGVPKQAPCRARRRVLRSRLGGRTLGRRATGLVLAILARVDRLRATDRPTRPTERARDRATGSPGVQAGAAKTPLAEPTIGLDGSDEHGAAMKRYEGVNGVLLACVALDETCRRKSVRDVVRGAIVTQRAIVRDEKPSCYTRGCNSMHFPTKRSCRR
jgi:hypothetical protein